MSKVQQSPPLPRYSRSNEGILMLDTVHTSSPWRAQLPLPKEIAATDITMMDTSATQPKSGSGTGGGGGSTKKENGRKWSLGGLFRRKKKSTGDSESSSCEDDRKAGFSVAHQKRTKPKIESRSRVANQSANKLVNAFDHIVVSRPGVAHPPPINSMHHNNNNHHSHHYTNNSSSNNNNNNNNNNNHHNHNHNNKTSSFTYRGFDDTDSIRSIEKAAAAAAAASAAASVDMSRLSGSLDRRQRREKMRAARLEVQAVAALSSEDESQSHSSSCIGRFRSDDSLTGSQSGSICRKSRSARTERYLNRRTRDHSQDTSPVPVHVVTQQVGRWKTQPIVLDTNYYGSSNSMELPLYQRSRPLQNSSSLTNVPGVTLNMTPATKNLTHHHLNAVHQVPPIDRRSISYENHIHQHRDMIKSPPPPPPPRDPQRRLTVNGGANNDPRPNSFAFDRHGPSMVSQNERTLNERCVSDDKLWGGSVSMAMSAMPTPPRPASVQQEPAPRRFITRHPENAYKYVTDATPRSRRPIAVLAEKLPSPPVPVQSTVPTVTPLPFLATATNRVRAGAPSPAQSASDFWRRIDKEECMRKLDVVKPAPVKSKMLPLEKISPVELPPFLKSFAPKPATAAAIVAPVPAPMPTSAPASLDVRTRSMPNYYSGGAAAMRQSVTPPKQLLANKYEEHVAKTIASKAAEFNSKPVIVEKIPPQIAPRPPTTWARITTPPLPPQRVASKRSSCSEDEMGKRRSTNLEEAINELEAIYKSLRLGDEDLLDRAERRDVITPTNDRPKRVEPANEDYDDGEDESTGEPDILLDDLVYRSLKHANSALKTMEPQPLFGIPIGPIAASPNSDYLHVPVVPPTAVCRQSKQPMHEQDAPLSAAHAPNVIADDLAYRSLRKDKGVMSGAKLLEHYVPTTAKKHRAVRSLSENIYSLIQRDAARPSGGDLNDYFDLERALERAGSLTEVAGDPHPDEPKETDSPLVALRKRTAMLRTPISGGAVYNLPSTLAGKGSSPDTTPYITKPPIPVPRQSLSPVVVDKNRRRSGMEDMLNALAREAKATSEKLGRDLIELRSAPKAAPPPAAAPAPVQIQAGPTAPATTKCKDIEEVSRAARACEGILKNVVKESERLADEQRTQKTAGSHEALMRDIKEVSDAAKVCEKMLEDVVRSNETTAAAAATPDNSKPTIITASPRTLLDNLDPERSQMEALADRCRQQLNALNDEYDGPDYDNLNTDLIKNGVKAAPIASRENSIEEEIDRIMKECAEATQKGMSTPEASKEVNGHSDATDSEKTPYSTPLSLLLSSPIKSSASDGVRSSSATPNRLTSSNITSFHAFSSSDNIKSPSNVVDEVTAVTKSSTCSSATPNTTNPSTIPVAVAAAAVESSPSPLALTPTDGVGVGVGIEVVGCDGDSSLYNSSEELAMIFGIGQPASPPSGVL